ncbi:hypothetical protein LINPERHAP1_LOCUS26626 [Linum perenne]
MIAWDIGYKKVHLQLDSLAAVTAILETQEEDSRHGRTLDSIYELRSRNWEVTISNIFREGNRVADLLAHHGHTLDFGFHVDCVGRWKLSFLLTHFILLLHGHKQRKEANKGNQMNRLQISNQRD